MSKIEWATKYSSEGYTVITHPDYGDIPAWNDQIAERLVDMLERGPDADIFMQVNLGDGSTIISDVYMVDGAAGVAFRKGNGEVGQDHTEEHAGEPLGNDHYLRVVTSNPDSLQVLIDKLMMAKASLVKENI